MAEVRVLSASGQIGSGFLESSLERGISLKPHVIACEADRPMAGQPIWAAARPHFSREGTKRDLRLMLLGRDKIEVPMIVGSCGFGAAMPASNGCATSSLRSLERRGSSSASAWSAASRTRITLKALPEGRITAAQPGAATQRGRHRQERADRRHDGRRADAAAIEQGAQVCSPGAQPTPHFLGGAADEGCGCRARPGMPQRRWSAAPPATVQRKRPDSIIAWIRDDHFDVAPSTPTALHRAERRVAHTLRER